MNALIGTLPARYASTQPMRPLAYGSIARVYTFSPSGRITRAVSKSASADELVEAIRQVMGGGRYVERDLAADLALNVFGSEDPAKSLSARELDIMRQLAKGKSLSAIADTLGISYKTVANACTAIKQKLLVQRTSDLIRLAVEMHAS